MSNEETFKVVLGQYKGVTAKRAKAEVTQAELDRVCKAEAKQFAQQIEVSDRAVKNGDIAVIDFKGFIDDIAFEGGAGNDYPLEIGSGTFIPGFEEQVEGAEIGKEIDVKVSFPDDYGAKDLAGKPAVFKVTVKKIKEIHMPELDKNVIEDIKSKLQLQKQQQVEFEYENDLINAVIEGSQMKIEEAHLEQEAHNLVKEWKAMLAMNGIDAAQYMKSAGLDDMLVAAQMIPQADLRIRSRLVLEAIAQKEEIEVSEFEVEKEIEKMAAQYKTTREDVKSKLTDEHIKALEADIRMKKAIDIIKENAVEPEA